MKRFLITTCVVLASFGITAGAALADSCENTSRAAPNSTGPGPIIKGNWVWLPSIGDRADRQKRDQRPMRQEVGSLGGQIDRYARAVDDERDGGRGRDEGFPLHVESKKSRGADATLISDEAPE